MISPTCCGQKTKSYVKLYYVNERMKKHVHSIEHGFKCLICGRIRIPFTNDNTVKHHPPEDLEQIREQGIKFDDSLR